MAADPVPVITSQPGAIAVYLRVSSEEQKQQGTIETQRGAVERWLAVRDERASWYADDGVSGTVPFASRPQGARLLADLHARRVSVVVCWRLDRMGRNAKGILDVVDAIRAAGANLVSVTESFDLSTPAGQLQLNMLAAVSQFERDSIMQRSSEGVARRLNDTTWMGGRAPFGYTVQGRKRDARLIINDTPDEAGGYSERDVYRLAWHLLVEQDQPINDIAERLDEMGIRTRDGGMLYPGLIYRMLVDPMYAGERTYRTKDGTVHVQAVPAIITREQHARALATLADHRRYARTRATGAQPYLLRGLVRCNECGDLYTTSWTNLNGGKGPRWRYYACSTRHFRSQYSRRHNDAIPHNCIGKSVDAADLERQVWAEIVNWADKPGPLLRELAGQFQSVSADEEAARAQAERASADREQVQAERDKVVTLFRTGALTETDLRHQLAELTDKEAVLRVKAERADEAVREGEEAKAAIEGARNVLAVLRAEIAAGPVQPARQREIVEVLVREIRVRTVPDGISRSGRQKNCARIRVVYRIERPDAGSVDAVPVGADGSTTPSTHLAGH
jgi:site-specific DNA recombinase